MKALHGTTVKEPRANDHLPGIIIQARPGSIEDQKFENKADVFILVPCIVVAMSRIDTILNYYTHLKILNVFNAHFPNPVFYAKIYSSFLAIYNQSNSFVLVKLLTYN